MKAAEGPCNPILGGQAGNHSLTNRAGLKSTGRKYEPCLPVALHHISHEKTIYEDAPCGTENERWRLMNLLVLAQYDLIAYTKISCALP